MQIGFTGDCSKCRAGQGRAGLTSLVNYSGCSGCRTCPRKLSSWLMQDRCPSCVIWNTGVPITFPEGLWQLHLACKTPWGCKGEISALLCGPERGWKTQDLMLYTPTPLSFSCVEWFCGQAAKPTFLGLSISCPGPLPLGSSPTVAYPVMSPMMTFPNPALPRWPCHSFVVSSVYLLTPVFISSTMVSLQNSRLYSQPPN